tara:strand:- start:1153 stop:1401 length:249 start_codon:yes stop_codon:yes gene_type:complete
MKKKIYPDPYLLIVAMEECGELIQACSKIYRYGNEKQHKKLLSEEIGDVLAMISLLIEEGYIDLEIAEKKKIAREKKHRRVN